MTRFIGTYTAARLAFCSEPAPYTCAGPHPLTVFAVGYLTNLQALQQEAHRRGTSPAQTTAHWVAHAFRWWGPPLSRYVCGQFAAAIVDHTHHTVTLVQDSLEPIPIGQPGDT